MSVLALAGPAPARAPAERAAPQIVTLRTSAPAVAGVPVRVEIRVRDPLAAVNGVQVDFGDGRGSLKQSACRPAGGAGAPLAGPFRPDGSVLFTVTHVFQRPGDYDLSVKATSGDCVLGPLMTNRRLRVKVRGLLPSATKKPVARLAQAGCPGAFDVPTRAGSRRAQAATLCLVNALRGLKGLAPLRGRRRLARAALRHSRDMVARQYFAHESPGGRDLLDRLRAVRYRVARAGENIGAGTDALGTPLGMVIAWAESPPHRANMLAERFDEAGVGVAEGYPDGGDGTTYTMIFGSRR